MRTTNPAEGSNSIAPDMALYASERWGHFSYALPVADGRYRLTLKFCEGHYGKRNSGPGGVGRYRAQLLEAGLVGDASAPLLHAMESAGYGRPSAFNGMDPSHRQLVFHQCRECQ